jgi:hypothetical protein
MNNLSLYELAADYRSEIERLADEPDAQKAADILDCIKGSLQDKAQNVALFIRSLAVSEAAIQLEIDRLNDLKVSVEKRHSALLKYLEANLLAAGVTEVKSPIISIAFQKNPPSVDVLCESEIPDEYWVTPPQPEKRVDKRKLLSDLKIKEIPGACLKKSQRMVIK